MTSSQKTRVGILRGGPGAEHHVSLASGAHILAHIDRDAFVPIDIYIDKDGVWSVDGIVTTPFVALKHIDIVINSLHGTYGEDGVVQKLLEMADIPYTGSDSLASQIAIDKHATKLIAKQYGVLTPKHVVIRPQTKDIDKMLVDVWQGMNHPLILKPLGEGSSVGIEIVHSFAELEKDVRARLRAEESFIIEEYIDGREVSVAVIEDMRGKKHYTPIALEIIHDDTHFSRTVKAKQSYHMRPMDNFSETERQKVIDASIAIHKALNLRHFSRSDFMISKHGVYFLEVNTIPGMTKKSILPKSLNESGISMRDFIAHMIYLAAKK